ncbi:MAG: phosphoribosylformylglycinamidine synthase subunit PurQ [Synechococcus sp. Tobar2m-G35]|nr:phosphoribosylformylglycinamidine synthase subunit PurQ [Synechococcus sp. Tobar2m-G35]
MTVGIVVFPGSNCDRDMAWAVQGCLGLPTRFLWHGDTELNGVSAVVLPGGFSYGDYLRCGALARFAPLLREVEAFARGGGPVLGVCNGFQVLTEMGLLPGALTRNRDLHFLCEPCDLDVEPGPCRLLAGYGSREQVQFPIAHGEGCWQCDDGTFAALEQTGQLVLRYRSNPNGSRGAVAGVCNATGNVLGLMPHPERACDPLLGGADGRRLLQALVG